MLQSRGFNRSPSITFAKPNTSNHLVLYFPNFVRSTFNSPYSQKALQLTSEVHPSISEVRPSTSEVLPSNSEIRPSNSEVLRANLIDAFPTASEVFARLNKVPEVHFVSPIALRDCRNPRELYSSWKWRTIEDHRICTKPTVLQQNGRGHIWSQIWRFKICTTDK